MGEFILPSILLSPLAGLPLEGREEESGWRQNPTHLWSSPFENRAQASSQMQKGQPLVHLKLCI